MVNDAAPKVCAKLHAPEFDATRRRVLAAAIALVPVTAWTSSTSPSPAPTAPVTPPANAPAVMSRMEQALARLKAHLERMRVLQGQASQAREEYKRLQNAEAKTQEELSARQVEMERRAAEADRYARMLENELNELSIELDAELLQQLAAAMAKDQAYARECRPLAGDLFTTGFIDARARDLMAQRRYEWNAERIRAAIARARAGITITTPLRQPITPATKPGGL